MLEPGNRGQKRARSKQKLLFLVTQKYISKGRRVAGGVDLVKKTWNGGDLFPKLTEVGSRLELGDNLGNWTRR